MRKPSANPRSVRDEATQPRRLRNIVEQRRELPVTPALRYPQSLDAGR